MSSTPEPHSSSQHSVAPPDGGEIVAATSLPVEESSIETGARPSGEEMLEMLDIVYPAAAQTPLLPPREPAGARIAALMGRHHTLLFALCVALSWAIIAAPSLWQRDAYERGEIASQDILAPHAAMLLDRNETARRRDEAAALVPPVYDPDPSAQPRALAKLRLIVAIARNAATRNQKANSSAQSTAEPLKVPQNAKNTMRRGQSTTQRDSTRRNDLNAPPIPFERPADRRAEVLQRRLNAQLESPMPLPLAAQLAQISATRWPLIERAAQSGVGAVYVGGQIRSDVSGDLDAARVRIERTARRAREQWPINNRESAIAATLARFVARTPNLVVNARATEKARQAARNEVRNVYLQVAASTPLIKARELITDERFEQLQDMNLVAPRFDWQVAGARFILCFAMVALSAGFLRYFVPQLLERPTALWLAAAVPLLFIGAFRLLLGVPHADAAAMPLAAVAAMLLAVLIDAPVGMLAGFLVAAFCSLMARADIGLLLAASMSAWTGTLAVASIASRGQLLRAGALLTVANAALSAMLGVFRDAPGDDILSMVMWGAGSGAMSVVAMYGLALSLERPFGITTHLRLLELLSPDETILQRMQSEAPGTYTHSMMVGSLSEAAAKAIEGADPLLCRVGGIYHDIGKLRRPHCFIENQGGENIHDRLSPQLSSLVILAHVKDGLELGRAIRLPQPVMDIIAQHHGTGLIAYFYERARAAAGEGVIDDSLFRYNGPRPQNKESAIVMLADTIEASARSLPNLTLERLQTHIGAMIAQRLQEGELSDSELTLRDLKTIENTFAHVLRGVLHQRIEYPDPARELREADERKAVEGDQSTANIAAPRESRRSRRRARGTNVAQSTTLALQSTADAPTPDATPRPAVAQSKSALKSGATSVESPHDPAPNGQTAHGRAFSRALANASRGKTDGR